MLLSIVNPVFASDSTPIHVTNILPIMQGSGLGSPKYSLIKSADQSPVFSSNFYLNLQSHANDAGSQNESLLIDGEVHQLAMQLNWQFAPLWQASIETSALRNTSGSLDGLIRDWHDLFGLQQGDRNTLEDDLFLYGYQDQELGSRLILDEATSGISDTELSVAYQFFSDQRFSVATYLSALLPTGDQAKATGSDKTDLKFTLAVGSNNVSSLAWHVNVDLISIGDDTLFAIPTKNGVWATSAGLHWQSNERWRWSAQLDGHDKIFNSAIDEIDKAAWQLTLAMQYGKHWQLYFSEDLTVNSAADFTIGINLLAYSF